MTIATEAEFLPSPTPSVDQQTDDSDANKGERFIIVHVSSTIIAKLS